MDIFEILKTWGVIGYGLAILFGGIAGIKLLPNKWETKYRFLAFSLFVAVIFVLLEVFVQKDFNPQMATKYLTTFCVVAVCYQIILKKIMVKWGWVKEETNEDKPK